MILEIILISFILLSIYVYCTKNYEYWKSQNVPQAPNPIPIFGHILPLFTLQDSYDLLLQKLYQEMGSNCMYGFYMMQTPALIIRDPELIKQILETNFDSFENNLYTLHKDLDPFLVKNPFWAKDGVWKETRPVSVKNMSGKKLRCFLVFVNGVYDKFKGYVDVKLTSGTSEFDSRDLFTRMTAELIANAAFGIEGFGYNDEMKNQSFVHIADKIFQPNKIGAVGKNIRFFIPKLANFLKISYMPSDVTHFVKHHVRNLFNKYSEDKNNDYLQFSIEDINKLEEDVLLARATSIFTDGYESISKVLSFMVYRIADNPDVQEKARQEVKSVLEKYEGYEAVKNMNYLDQVFSETLRMNPSFGDISKICTKEINLRGYDGLECKLKPGNIVIMSISATQNDQEFWPDPEKFDPERFSPEEVEKRSKYLFLGFGQGPRTCVARRMGMLIGKAVLAKILMNYSLEVSKKMKGPIVVGAEGKLWVNFEPLRTNSEF